MADSRLSARPRLGSRALSMHKVVYLHIGPHKTGTTSLQSTLLKEVVQLRSLGVEYISTPGRGNANFSARAIRNKPSQKLESAVAVPMSYWTDVVRAVRASSARACVISGEGFADCNDEEIARIARDLAPSQLRIVLTLRPIAKILPSQWQQYVQNAMRREAFDEWLMGTLDEYDEVSSREDVEGFWRRHQHDRLAAKWSNADALGKPIVVIADESEPAAIMRGFEALLNLPPGTLMPGKNLSNRSLTLPEIELVRAYYNRLHDEGFEQRVFRRGISIRPALYLKEQRTPAKSEARVQIPTNRVERVKLIADQIVIGLKGQPLEVKGDLERLRYVEIQPQHTEASVHVSAELAAYFTIGMLAKLGVVSRRGKVLSSKWIPLRDFSRRIAPLIPGGPTLLSLLKRILKRVLP